MDEGRCKVRFREDIIRDLCVQIRIVLILIEYPNDYNIYGHFEKYDARIYQVYTTVCTRIPQGTYNTVPNMVPIGLILCRCLG